MINFWILLIISSIFLVILFIVIRHFPELAILDAENIPEEKESLVKEKLIKQRIKRKFAFLDNFFNKILVLFNKISDNFWNKLSDLEKKQKEKKEEKSLSEVSTEDKIKILFSQAEDFIKQENWIEAEKKLIELISLDDKNFLAFLELGEVYHSEQKWQEAKQTLLYANKLGELNTAKVSFSDMANLNYSLALINKELKDLDSAYENIKKSLDLDQKNPRYLDFMLNLCIIKRNKLLSIEYLNKIKEVNPDNNNISNWEEDISLL